MSSTIVFQTNEAADKWNKATQEQTGKMVFTGGSALTIGLLVWGVAAAPFAIIGGVYAAMITFFLPSAIPMHRGDYRIS